MFSRMFTTSATYEPEYLETQSTTCTIRYEWHLRDLKNIFEPSTDADRTKAIKSPKFGGGRWQIIFNGTSASDGDWTGIFLISEVHEEKERAPNGKWAREGKHSFSFEVLRPDTIPLQPARNASDHTFSYKAKCWGWDKFALRSKIYFRDEIVKKADWFIIICVIGSSLASSNFRLSYRSVPNNLLHTIGGLLNEPAYSDVEILLPGSRPGTSPRKILASRKLLKRTGYFESLFDSGFSEVCPQGTSQVPLVSPDKDSYELKFLRYDFDDSDDSEDEMLVDGDNVGNGDNEHSNSDFQSKKPVPAPTEPPKDVSLTEVASTLGAPGDVDMDARSHDCNIIAKSSDLADSNTTAEEIKLAPDRQRTRIVVRDVAFSTYYAVLYYIYTDLIVFAPLSSSFNSSNARSPHTPSPTSDSEGSTRPKKMDQVAELKSRKDWIQQWRKNNPGRPAPCSAKSAYRLADKLDLLELKETAFQFIVKSLTIDNIFDEVFSSFSMMFDDVRKVQIKFVLDNWATIHNSEAMSIAWQQIRSGRHPGFEEGGFDD